MESLHFEVTNRARGGLTARAVMTIEQTAFAAGTILSGVSRRLMNNLEDRHESISDR
jgi:hypothetical protein